MQRSAVNNHAAGDHSDGLLAPSTEQDDARKEGEADITALSHIEQRLLETQKQRELFKAKAASAQILEKKYEELAQKHKALIAQLQQMVVMIEHYKVLVGQLEQEKILLLAENKSLKAQESVTRDKAMLYNLVMERAKKLEEENSSLVVESERQQKMYEKCLETVSAQVMEAIYSQQVVREECKKLQERVLTLESQNSDFNELIQSCSCCGNRLVRAAAAAVAELGAQAGGSVGSHPNVPAAGGGGGGGAVQVAAAAAAPMLGHMSSSDTRLQQLLPYLSAADCGGNVSARKAKLRAQAASPSADSVQSMPAAPPQQAARCWALTGGGGGSGVCSAGEGGCGSSMGSLDFDQFADAEQFAGGGGVPEMSSPPVWLAAGSAEGSVGLMNDGSSTDRALQQQPPRSQSVDSELTSVCIETEFPANSGSPKMRRVERHSSSGSLDASLYHARGFVKFDGSDVRHGRSASAEALRDARIVRPPMNGKGNGYGFASASATPRLQARANHPAVGVSAREAANVGDSACTARAAVPPLPCDGGRPHHESSSSSGRGGSIETSAGSTAAAPAPAAAAALTGSSAAAASAVAPRLRRTGDDIFSDDADDILAKHRSLLVVGSFEDLFELGKNAAAAAAESDGGSRRHHPGAAEPAAVSALGEQEQQPPPLPPPRSRSRCSSLSSINSAGDDCDTSTAADIGGGLAGAQNPPPPLPPRGSRRSLGKPALRRPSKPLPQEPPEQQQQLWQQSSSLRYGGDDGSQSPGGSTDTESIKQEMNALASQLAELAAKSAS